MTSVMDVIRKERTVSFEVYPPKNGDLESLFKVIDRLQAYSPSFISVTCGAGGTNRTGNVEIAKYIKSKGIIPVVHLTAGPLDESSLSKMIETYKLAGINSILCIRGDKPKDLSIPYGTLFLHSNQLMARLMLNGFEVLGACFPEGHVEDKDLNQQVKTMLLKEDAGTQVFITQLFFDNSKYYDFVKKAQSHGITSPIIPGIMPVISEKSLNHITTLNRISVPDEVRNMVKESNVRELGIKYAAKQLCELAKNDIPGVHIYTMNSADIIDEVYSYLDQQGRI